CEFVGFAIYQGNNTDIEWYVATGSNNNMYKKLSVCYGKGIAGRVISTGEAIEITDFPNCIEGHARDYPIMLAEELSVAFATPITKNDLPVGVLLAGRRENNPITRREQRMIWQAAKDLAI